MVVWFAALNLIEMSLLRLGLSKEQQNRFLEYTFINMCLIFQQKYVFS